MIEPVGVTIVINEGDLGKTIPSRMYTAVQRVFPAQAPGAASSPMLILTLTIPHCLYDGSAPPEKTRQFLQSSQAP